MSSPLVWIQLYYEGKDEPVGNPIFIKTASLDPPVIAALIKQVVKEELKKELHHAGLTDISVFSPGTKPPFSDAISIRPGKKVVDLIEELKNATPLTSDDHPLIVVAPLPAPHPPGQDLTAINEQIQAFKPALEFAKKEMEEATDHKPMSAASFGFAKLLLEGYQISVEADEPCMEPGQGEEANPTPYEWKVETKDGDTIKNGEHQETPEAMKWFKHHFLKESARFDLVLVTKKPLPKLKGNGKSAAGEGDLVIGNVVYITRVDNPYQHAYGLVELKTDEYKVKPGQCVLELASLSTTSRFGRNVALLATDCKDKWQLYYFKDSKTILQREYLHSMSSGRKCWEDFKTLIDNAEARQLQAPTARYKQTLSGVVEADEQPEQDLGGFDSKLEDSKTKALEKQAMLETLANGLAEVYGERPIVPAWATAQATCPDYYIERLNH